MTRVVQVSIVGLLLLPFSAAALTADELRVQINDLLGKIQALQAQIGATPAAGTVTGATPSGGTPAPAGTCPRVSRVLKKGDSGADVTRLQQFLALDPSVYPEAQVSGYYGELTEAAVKRFQCKNKIVCDGDAASTGYGVTGPRTGAILALQCPDSGSGNAGQQSGFIKVSPTVGVSPLSVTVDATVNTARSCAAQTYHIDFGDGTAPVSMYVPANRCGEVQQVFPHVYHTGGIYQILLRAGTHQVAATVHVTQGSGTVTAANDTLRASPLTGAPPLTVNFSGTVNAAGQCNAGPYSINFGDGKTASLALSGCSASTFQVPHTYTSGGAYTARLYRGEPAVSIASVVIEAEGSASTNGGLFSVETNIGGNLFAVRARFDIASSCSRYDLDWGDGSSHVVQAEGSCSSGTVSREFTHTYQNAGSYTVTLKRGASLNSTDTAAVTIVQ